MGYFPLSLLDSQSKCMRYQNGLVLRTFWVDVWRRKKLGSELKEMLKENNAWGQGLESASRPATNYFFTISRTAFTLGRTHGRHTKFRDISPIVFGVWSLLETPRTNHWRSSSISWIFNIFWSLVEGKPPRRLLHLIFSGSPLPLSPLVENDIAI
jgi:hypothetical protein